MPRGQLRVYLGAAPGVGKTYTMLCEGHRRRDRGTDVFVGFVETHGRAQTGAMVGDLEVIPRRTIEYRGAAFTEMDVDAILARHPEVALVDELAHTNVPGSRNEKRWQDVQELLAAGINVITTVNVQHLESLNDVVAKITGVPQRETVPDAVVRAAEQVELIDMTAEALRRRMAHGNIYAADKVDAALANYFRIGNLTALRELAMLWLADKVDEQLDHYREQHAITGVWETRERVVVALTGGPEGETLIRRAARIADRSHGGDLLAVHIAHSDGLTGADPSALVEQRHLVETLGGTYHQVVGDDIPTALLQFARAEHATQLVLGASRRGRLATFLTGPGIGATTTRLSGDIDVHLVTHEWTAIGRGPAHLPALSGGLTLRRRLQGALLAAFVLPLLTLLLTRVRTDLNLTSDALIFLLVVVVVALLGGFYPALAAAVGGSQLLNYYFIPPIHRWTIAERNNVLALVVFVAVAGLVSSIVDVAARRTRQAARASAEAQTLVTTAGSVLRGEAALPQLLERLRETFGMTSVALLERRPAADNTASGDWSVLEAAGPPVDADPFGADVEVPISANLLLVLYGRVLPAEDRHLLGGLAAHIAAALEQRRLTAAAEAVKPLAEADRTRTALLAAASHDLRSPLASAQAAVGSLSSHEVHFSPAEQAELLDTATDSLDKLSRLVDNLLDMSRLQAGALSVLLTPVAIDELMPHVIDDLGPDGRGAQVHVPDSLPQVRADPGLLERVLVNVLRNALRYSPGDQPPLVTGSELGDRVELRVIDRGPGIPPDDREKVFAPFQRLGDHDNTTGLGLGLALARGLTEAMHGTLTPEETPGGGLTMVLALPTCPSPTDASGNDRYEQPTATEASSKDQQAEHDQVGGAP
jgi:two-component system, OmpR family, sensor histidine kinase KdpD